MFAATKTSVDIDKLLATLSEEDILKRYLNIPYLPCVINSPFREDNNPSFWVGWTKSGHIYWKDYGTGEKGGILSLVMKILNISFKDTLQRILEDFLLLSTRGSSRAQKSVKRHTITLQRHFKLAVKVREWREWDIEYWNRYGITIDLLKKARVYPVSHVILEKENGNIVISADKYAYAYVEFKDNVVTIKVYQPFSLTHKWLNQHTSSTWSLWDMLPEFGEKLIITSSTKDALCIIQNCNIPSCSLQAESYLPKKKIIEQLKSRFKDIYVLYDNDSTKPQNYGREFGNKIATLFGLKQIEIPDSYASKDPSDLYVNHGKDIFKQVINSLIT